jgi:spermidine dehydrogenase
MTRKIRSEDRRLGMDRAITRRDIVNGAMAGAGAALMAGPIAEAAMAPPPLSAKAGPAGPVRDAFTGRGGVGDYALANGNTQPVIEAAHRIRDATFDGLPSADDAEQVDLVIVGGGPAGLMTAYEYARLTGGKKTCLILENHPIFGGAAKQNDFLVSGVRLTGPQASNDFGAPAKGSGNLMDRLYDELNLPRHFDFSPMASGYKPVRFAWGQLYEHGRVRREPGRHRLLLQRHGRGGQAQAGAQHLGRQAGAGRPSRPSCANSC